MIRWLILYTLMVHGNPAADHERATILKTKPAPVPVAPPSQGIEGCKKQLERYLKGAVSGLDRLRGADGVVRDTVRVRKKQDSLEVESYKDEVAPTDLALDFLVQLALLDHSEYRDDALKRLVSSLEVIRRLPRHPDTGLFFRLYKEGEPLQRDLSSVDNMHLALALWTIARSPKIPPELAQQTRQVAEELFKEMNFSRFYDSIQNLIGGNLKADESGGYSLEPYRYHLGSEARSVYLLGWALELFPGVSDKQMWKALKKVEIPTSPEGRLLFWDGGLFQALLPSLLIGEPNYSRSYADHRSQVLSEVLKTKKPVRLSDGSEVQLPLAPSASLIELRGQALVYGGKVGLASLKDPMHKDAVLEDVFVPHGALLAGLGDPCVMAKILQSMELESAEGIAAFEPKLGWVASARITAENRTHQIRPIPGLVGVDKGIEALALAAALDPQGLSPSAATLLREDRVRRRLEAAYRLLDKRLSN